MKAVLAVFLVAACGEVKGSDIDSGTSDASGDAGATDGSTIDGGPAAFSPPVAVAALNSTSAEISPSLTDDQLLIYFISNRPGGAGGGDVWSSARASLTAPWSTPVMETQLSSGANEHSVSISGDGLEIFVSADPTELTLIYTARRTSRSFSWPALTLVRPLSIGDSNVGVSLTADGLTAYFSADAGGKQRIWTATRATPTSAWATPTRVVELEGPGDEGRPSVNATNTMLVFQSYERPGNLGEYDLYASTRASAADPWGPVVSIAELNTTTSDITPWLSDDAKTLYFARGTTAADIYAATR